MPSSNPPSASAENISIPATCNGNRASPPSPRDGIQTSPTRRQHAHMSNNSILALILLFQIFLLTSRCFPFHIIDFHLPQHSILLRILDPRCHAGLFSLPLIGWLWQLLDRRRPGEIRAHVRREWVERDTNVYLIQMMGCLAASTITGDAVELFERFVKGFAADIPFDELGTMEMGGVVLFSMGLLFMITMLSVSLVWRLVWVPVLVVADVLPGVEGQKFSKRCAEEAKGRSSSAVNGEGFGHSVRETAALDVHGSNNRSIDVLLSCWKEYLYLGFVIARKIAWWLFLNDLWEASMRPILILQFLSNKRSGRIDAVVSGDYGSSHSPGHRTGIHKDAEAEPHQMKHSSDALNAVSANPNETEVDEWEKVEVYAGE